MEGARRRKRSRWADTSERTSTLYRIFRATESCTAALRPRNPMAAASGNIRWTRSRRFSGALFDIAGLERVDALPRDFVVEPEHLEACGVRPPRGGIALIRTGWARFWDDAKQYITGGDGLNVCGPGPAEPAARWLSKHGIFAAGF